MVLENATRVGQVWQALIALALYYLAWAGAGALLWPVFRHQGAGLLHNWMVARILGPTAVALLAFHAARWSGKSLGFGVVVAAGLVGMVALVQGRVAYRVLMRRRILIPLLQCEGILLLMYGMFAGVFGLHYGHLAMGERRLDLGLVNWLMQAPAFPADNFWAVGERLSYYYLGCLQVGVLGLASRATGEHAYFGGLCVTWVSVVAAAWVAGRALGVRGWGCYLPPVALVFMGSGAPLFQWVVAGALPWQPDAFLTYARIVPGTINELPAVALWMSEVHAHVLALPLFVMLFPQLLLMLRGAGGPRGIVLFSIVAASLLMTDAWLVPTAAMACGFIALQQVIARTVTPKQAIVRLAAATLLTLLLASPLLVGFNGHPMEPKLVRESTTTAIHLLVLFGPVLGLAGAVWMVQVRGAGWQAKRRGGLCLALIAAGGLTVALCEMFYLETGFAPPAERQNTVMRLHWAGYVCFALAVAPASAVKRRPHRRLGPGSAVAMLWLWVLAFTALGMISPVRRIFAAVSSGRAWNADFRRPLDPAYRGLVRVSEFFRSLPPSTVLLESSGPPYQGFASISAMSGRRTVLGEIDKVFSHGLTQQQVEMRLAELKQVYSDGPNAEQVLVKYGVEYLVLGPAEEKAYGGGLGPGGVARAALLRKYPVVFSSGAILVLRTSRR